MHYYWKWTSYWKTWLFYWKTCLFSENCDILCDCLYTSRNCRILIKTLIFLRKCLFVHVLIFIRVFLLLENCYFDSKYDFIRKVTSVFLNINFCAKLSIFGEKKLKFCEKFWLFQTIVVSVNILLENMLIFRKFWLFVWMSIYIKKLSNLIKTTIFLWKCLFISTCANFR